MKIKKIASLRRDKISLSSRKNYLRLDKNERVSNFTNKIINNIQLDSFDLTAYPETGKIYKQLSKINKLTKENFILTAGSEFGIRMCFEYFCTNKNKKIITLEPTFGMVEVYSKLFNLKQIKINYNKKFKLDFDKLYKKINKNISLVILANPNSPTGTIIEETSIINILKKSNRLNIPVLIDEAYEGFYRPSYLKLIKKFSNLIILRTFSKSFGLAGLRAGYLISNKKLIFELYKYKPMYEINSAASKAVLFLLKNQKYVKDYINQTLIGKSFFEKELKKIKIPFLKTYANFIHIKLSTKKNRIEAELKKRKILTRKGPGVIGYEDYLRITLGPKNEMKKVITVLNKYFK